MRYIFEVSGMMCEHCEARLLKGLRETPGISEAEVSLAKKCAEVETELLPEQIIARIDEIGFGAVQK